MEKVTMPRNPIIMKFYLGNGVWDAVPQHSVGVNDMDIVNQSQVFKTRAVVFIAWNGVKILLRSRKAQVNNLMINSWLIIKVKWSF